MCVRVLCIDLALFLLPLFVYRVRYRDEEGKGRAGQGPMQVPFCTLTAAGVISRLFTTKTNIECMPSKTATKNKLDSYTKSE
jgi:hypothetical protein